MKIRPVEIFLVALVLAKPAFAVDNQKANFSNFDSQLTEPRKFHGKTVSQNRTYDFTANEGQKLNLNLDLFNKPKSTPSNSLLISIKKKEDTKNYFVEDDQIPYAFNASFLEDVPADIVIANKQSVFLKAVAEIEKSRSAIEFDNTFHKALSIFENEMSGTYDDQLATCYAIKNFSLDTVRSMVPLIERGLEAGGLVNCSQQIYGILDRALYLKKASFSNTSLPIPIKMEYVEREIDPSLEYISLQGFGPKEVMLTFDDGPTVRTTLPILDTLDSYGVKAAFFSTGRQAQTNARIMREINQRGHLIASHSYYHTLMMGREVNRGNMSYDYFLSELIGGHLGVYGAAQNISPYFRFPNGCMNQTMKKNVSELGLTTFGWSVDSFDWQHTPTKYPNQAERSEAILKTFITQLKKSNNRGIVLMHDIYSQSAEALPFIMDYLAQNNFKIVLLKKTKDHTPIIDEARAHSQAHGSVLSDFRPASGLKGRPVSPMDYVAGVNYNDIFPQLSKMPMSKIDPSSNSCEYAYDNH